MLDHEQEIRFAAARRRAIARDFYRLNAQQQEAVLTTQGPLLLLAGAGSGKTTVLINRIANLMRYGRGSDSPEVPQWVTPDDLAFLEGCAQGAELSPEDRDRRERLCCLDPAQPWTILAITFTNKAAGELKDRLTRMLGLHLPLRLCAYFAPGHREAGLCLLLHHLRLRRLPAGHQGVHEAPEHG